MKLNGIVVLDKIVPSNSENTYPTHESIYGKGGWREVSSIPERNKIAIDRRSNGMAVFVTETGLLYILNATDDQLKLPELPNEAWFVFNNGLTGSYLSSTNPSGTGRFKFDGIISASQNISAATIYSNGVSCLTEHQPLNNYYTKDEANSNFLSSNMPSGTGTLKIDNIILSSMVHTKTTEDKPIGLYIDNTSSLVYGTLEDVSMRTTPEGSVKPNILNVNYGIGNKITGLASFVAGNTNVVQGNYAVALNASTSALHNSTLAHGEATQATGNKSHAEGNNTCANSIFQHVEGQYNIKDSDNLYQHIVGNGTEEKFKNIQTLDWSGNLWNAGEVSATSFKLHNGVEIGNIHGTPRSGLTSLIIPNKYNVIYAHTLTACHQSFVLPESELMLCDYDPVFRLQIITTTEYYDFDFATEISWVNNNVPDMTLANSLYLFVFEYCNSLGKWRGNLEESPISLADNTYIPEDPEPIIDIDPEQEEQEEEQEEPEQEESEQEEEIPVIQEESDDDIEGDPWPIIPPEYSAAPASPTEYQVVYLDTKSNLKIISYDEDKTDFSNYLATSTITNLSSINLTKATTLNKFCYRRFNLSSITSPLYTTNVNDMSNAFNYCDKLQYIESLDLKSCTNTTNMFYYCTKLSSINHIDNITTDLDLSQTIINYETFHRIISALVSGVNPHYLKLPEIILSCLSYKDDIQIKEKNWYINGISTKNDCKNTYKNNTNYTNTITYYDTANCINFSAMFQNNYKLKLMPQYNTSAGQYFNHMFYACSSLTKAPLLDTSKAVTFDYMFYNCNALTAIPTFNTSNVSSFIDTFGGCNSLLKFPKLDYSNAIQISYIFSNIQNIIPITAAKQTNFTIDDYRSTLNVSTDSSVGYGDNYFIYYIPTSPFLHVENLNFPKALSSVLIFYNTTLISSINTLSIGSSYFNYSFSRSDQIITIGRIFEFSLNYKSFKSLSTLNLYENIIELTKTSFDTSRMLVFNYYDNHNYAFNINNINILSKLKNIIIRSDAVVFKEDYHNNSAIIKLQGLCGKINNKTININLLPEFEKVSIIDKDGTIYTGKLYLNCEQMFYSASNLTTIPDGICYILKKADEIDGSKMFMNCSSLINIPADFTTSSFINMESMFEKCTNLNNLDNISLAGIKSQDATSLTESDCKKLYRTFYNCTSIKRIPDKLFNEIQTKFPEPLFYYNTSNRLFSSNIVKYTNSCFTGCTALKAFSPDQWSWLKEHRWCTE